jgi:selenocysteine lyase/cysteine desulfurase
MERMPCRPGLPIKEQHRLGRAELLATPFETFERNIREQLARVIAADPRDVYFTSGGTESNAIGVLGTAEASRGRHIVVSAFEHSSVLEAARRLGARGYFLTEVPPEPSGVVSAERLAEAVLAGIRRYFATNPPLARTKIAAADAVGPLAR